VVETRITDDEGKTKTIYRNEYLGEVQLVGQVLDNSGKVVSTFQNEYSNGLLSVQTEKDENGNVRTISKYSRNESNDITEYFVSNPALSSEYKFIINYEYDRNGNWIKQTQFYDGKIIAIITRNITYFDDVS
jgi:antitoxin component YwqK of YwqJK toxin-antitoxin module